MNNSEIDVNEYVRRLLEDKGVLESEYRSYEQNDYTIQNICGILSSESLYAVIRAARWNRKVRKLLNDLLWYIDELHLMDAHFRMLLKFPRRDRNNYVGVLVHKKLSFYQMQVLNRYPNSFEAFGWLLDRICSSDMFTEEDMLQLLRENADVTKYGMQACVDYAYETYGPSSKLDAAAAWIAQRRE